MQNHLYTHSLQQAQADNLIIIDIRRPEEINTRPLPQAQLTIEMTDLLANPSQHLDPNKRYLLVCAAGIRSNKSAAELHQQGYTNVLSYPSAW